MSFKYAETGVSKSAGMSKGVWFMCHLKTSGWFGDGIKKPASEEPEAGFGNLEGSAQSVVASEEDHHHQRVLQGFWVG